MSSNYFRKLVCAGFKHDRFGCPLISTEQIRGINGPFRAIDAKCVTVPNRSTEPQEPPGKDGTNCCECNLGSRGPRGYQGPRGPKGEKGPAGTLDSAYGFAYSESESFAPGYVKFIIAGPLQDVELIREGLRVSKAGVYEISYKVILESKYITCIPSNFQIIINDAIKVASSMTESTTSTTLTSTNLLSLLEGDVVKLVADLQEHFSYKLATLQLIQVG